MKKNHVSLLFMTPFILGGCFNQNGYVLNEKSFFLVMTNIQYYPEEYIGKSLTFDCYTYELESVSGDKYLCCVRKCSSGFGCKCGKDTIIGFVVDQNIGLPAPIKQYENNNEKAWVHIIGQIENTNKTQFEIYGADNSIEQVQFLSLTIDEFSLIEDYSNLHYYVS